MGHGHEKVLCVGGVRYVIFGDATPGFEALGPAIRAFLSEEPAGSDTMDVIVRVVFENAPQTGEWEILFNSGAAWTIRRKGETRAAVFQPPGFDVPFWTALFDRDGLQVDVYIDPSAEPQPFPPLSHPLDQMILVNALAFRNGGLLHSTGVGIDGRGLLFGGKSGAGKSTLASLFSGQSDVTVLSDERVVIRENPQGFRIYGTPWHSDNHDANPTSMPLSAVFFLHHGQENRIDRCERSTALHHLLPLVSIPWYDRDRIPAMMDLCGRIVDAIPCYHLYFRPDHDVTQRIMDVSRALGEGRVKL